MRQIAPPLPGVDDTGDRLVLRDGSVASVRYTTLEDAKALGEFFHNLSPQSRYQRFFSAGEPPAALVAKFSDSSDPSQVMTLIAERATGIIATASCLAIRPGTAEVAFAVADGFQGRGLATALLERLAVAAGQQGLTRFEATTLAGNTQMLEVFRESGFEIRAKSEAGGSVAVTLSISPSAAAVAREEARNRAATVASLRPMFAPRSVAIIGASRQRSNIGRRILDAMVAAGFNGSIHPVNSRAGEVAGLKAYASARDLPHDVDLAVIAVPGDAVPGVVDDCAAAGVRSLVVITAGYAESGSPGRERQQQLTEQVRGYGMRMVGPNCMGLLNTDRSVRLNASFSPVFPPHGHIGLLSQSGAIGIAILELATERRLGLSTFISAGNKADVSGNDLLEYWEQDPSTHVLLLYLESFGNPRRFARLARRIGRTKPIVVVKSGRTRAGSRAAGSHTAAIAVSDVTVDSLFEQSGVIRADTLDEMFDVAACLDLQPLPAGRRVAIITNAGGPGIMAADACEAAGLTLAELSDRTRAQLSALLPGMASVGNPVDMIASAGPEPYRHTIEALLAALEVDSIIVIFTPVETDTAGPILEAIRDAVHTGRLGGATNKPVLACVMATPGRPIPIDAIGERLPAFAFPENAARALGKATAYATWRAKPQGLLWDFDDCDTAAARAVCRDALSKTGDGWLKADGVQGVLRAVGVPLVAGRIAHSAAEAAAYATETGFPAAAKVSSREILHKSDRGLVYLDLLDAAAVSRAYDDIVAAAQRDAPDAVIDGVLIQPMVKGGVETMMGIVHDSLFGPLVAFGLGGIHVEVFKDVRIRMAPLSDRDVDDVIHGIKGFPLLQGYRGHPAADLEALKDVLLRLSRLASEIPEIAELDLNPVMALAPGQGCRVVDARIRVRTAPGKLTGMGYAKKM